MFLGRIALTVVAISFRIKLYLMLVFAFLGGFVILIIAKLVIALVWLVTTIIIKVANMPILAGYPSYSQLNLVIPIIFLLLVFH